MPVKWTRSTAKIGTSYSMKMPNVKYQTKRHGEISLSSEIRGWILIIRTFWNTFKVKKLAAKTLSYRIIIPIKTTARFGIQTFIKVQMIWIDIGKISLVTRIIRTRGFCKITKAKNALFKPKNKGKIKCDCKRKMNTKWSLWEKRITKRWDRGATKISLITKCKRTNKLPRELSYQWVKVFHANIRTWAQ